ncbi:MAG: UDP-N-acetylmuramate--L-alanine ligase [Armatimonadetes bacterium]|nr:UDP-N-acetylmuramate--L-alanine ligase [Armatimonadota bacterium]
MKSRVHMIGIGGIGMSALAQILLARGYDVSGSDTQATPLTAKLEALGARIYLGHAAEHVDGAARVVVSDAIADDNSELLRARELGRPLQRRSELLAELMADKQGIAISGTHGKTTVTAMVASILVEAGLDPTLVIGGEYAPLGGNARAGNGDWFVAEACEAYESFLHLQPRIAVITNIEPDHLDHHGTAEHLRQSFVQFLERVPEGGTVVLCADRPEMTSLPLPADRRVVWYGTRAEADVQGAQIVALGRSMRCELFVQGAPSGELVVGAPGLHNLVNALSATAAAIETGASVEACRRALREFAGVGRRFEVVGEAAGVVVIDDYAHHPTEIGATIAAARSVYPERRLVALFQPHLYSRTRDFADQFAASLAAADLTVLTPIYPAREQPISGVTSALIAASLRASAGEDAVLEVAKEAVAETLPQHLRTGDVILVMGAGDIGDVARELVRQLGGSTASHQHVVTKQ